MGYPSYDASVLEDGTYDVVVVDAEAIDASEGGGDADRAGSPALRIEAAVLAGPHKGEVVAITAVGLDHDPLDLLAMPGTVTVADGRPTLALEP